MIGDSLGPYRILELLGSGGMGEVYLAEDGRLGRRVAVKVLPPEFAGDAARMARLEQEARATSALNHPGICTLYDIGTHDGQPFLVMEALDGSTLHQEIGGRPLPGERLLAIAIQVAEALGEAHAKGVIHRDLKAANVFVTRDGRAKILDFGLAKLTSDVAPGPMSSMPTSAPAGQLTREGSTLGTVAYMSPEQARGQQLDARSDIFSFGVVLYEMATGKVPFDGPTEAVVFDKILNHEAPSPVQLNPGLPTGLVRLISRTLAKDPAARPASSYEIKGQLEEIRRAPGSLESVLPAEHVSSTREVKPPPRPEVWDDEPEDPEDLDDAGEGLAPAPAADGPSGPGVAAGIKPPPTADDETRSRRQPESKPSIAVLPFSSLSADPEDEFFAAGLAEEIINALAHLKGLDVAARTSAFSFKGKHADVREIGDKLGVGHVLEGSVRRAGARLRVTVQLVAAEAGYQIWSERYDREMEDIFAIQDEITEAIVKVLEVRLVSGQSGETVRRAPTSSSEAFELFLKGRHFWAARTPQSMLRAAGFFERAIELDPDFAAAWAGLADAYAILGAYQVVHPAEAAAKARPAIEKAIALDPTLPEPHFSTGFLHLALSDDWLRAEGHLRRALDLNPRDAVARVYLGVVLAMSGRRDEGIEHVLEAKRRDPLSAFIHALAALAYRPGGESEAAITTCRESLDLDPHSTLAKWLLAFCYSDAGRLEEAIGLAEAAVAAAQRHPTFLGILGYMYARAGRRDDALAIIAEIEGRSADSYVSPIGAIEIYVALGDMEKLKRYVEVLLEQGGGVLALYATCRPDLAALRDDPIAGPAIRRLPIWPENGP